MTRVCLTLCWVVVGAGFMAAAAVVVTTPFGRPYGQPASQASPGANKLSPPFGDYQAQGRGR